MSSTLLRLLLALLMICAFAAQVVVALASSEEQLRAREADGLAHLARLRSLVAAARAGAR